MAEATAEYQAKSDHLELFLDECCQREPSATVGTTELFKRYREWCEDVDEVSLSIQAFTDGMEKKGFMADRLGTERKRVWRGLRLYSDAGAVPDPTTETGEASAVTT